MTKGYDFKNVVEIPGAPSIYQNGKYIHTYILHPYENNKEEWHHQRQIRSFLSHPHLTLQFDKCRIERG